MARGKRILLAKMGLDCHDTGIVIVGQMLREAGFEVVYMGLHNDADEVVHAAIDEDTDLIGISFLSGQHESQVRRLLAAMREADLDIPVVCGGVIPPDDAAGAHADGRGGRDPAGHAHGGSAGAGGARSGVGPHRPER